MQFSDPEGDGLVPSQTLLPHRCELAHGKPVLPGVVRTVHPLRRLV